MKKLLFLLHILLIMSITASAQQSEKGPYTIYTIGKDIYHIEDATAERPAGNKLDKDGKFISNNNCSDMYLVVGKKKALLIDLSNFIKYDNTAVESLRALVYEKAGDKELLVTVTHRHGDHTGMLPAFKDDEKAKFWIPKDEFEGMKIFPDDRTTFFPENTLLDLGGYVINTMEVPGHTAHSTLFFVKGENMVFTGDALGSGSGVWLFNYDSFIQYIKGVDGLISYIEDPANKISKDKLVIWGGHYWQKGKVEKLTSQYVYDMKALIGRIGLGTAEAAAYTTQMKYLDTNFKYGTATITWNREDAAKYSMSVTVATSPAIAQTRWAMQSDGSIKWTVTKGEAHTDNIEMSGRFISGIVTYGIDDKGKMIISRQLVFPMLRTIPNDTRGNFIYAFGQETEPLIKINNRPVNEIVTSFSLRGKLTIESSVNNNILITREIYPSVDKPVLIERITLTNNSTRDASVEVEDFDRNTRSQKEKSVYGVYEISARMTGSGLYNVKPNEKLTFALVFSGRKLSDPLINVDIEKELAKREAFVEQMFGTLQFDSPDPVVNRMFSFARIRAMESIYETKGGLVHSPGGANYYAAIWANDQAEYANPFFAYTGYQTAIEAGMVSWSWFAKYLNPEYKSIPSSIIAEGTDFWNGAGDRGDMAMIAYGASRFALALGDRQKAEELWPLIEWCIEYCRRKMTPEGIIASDSDELEGRFPAGKANLCTSSLYYDALISASYLARDLGKSKKLASQYSEMAKNLKASIDKYFGATMDGFQTYRYYDGNDVLRSWICTPLTVGIYDRAAGTTDALFSPKLWTDQGLLTQAGTTTFWDRSTLYGLRGVIAAGAADRALPFLHSYSERRLLGDHVPYAVEAWPEGNQRHLSAESALYCRVITEGLFGFRPAGLSSFSINPQLPEQWDHMNLKNLIAFGGKKIDISVKRNGTKIYVEVIADGKTIKSLLMDNKSKLDIKF